MNVAQPSKLIKGTTRTAHTKPAKSGKVVRAASQTLHAKHNPGVKQPFIEKGM